jgi:FemAB-related protein (PEP-CTERM system-associated)
VKILGETPHPAPAVTSEATISVEICRNEAEWDSYVEAAPEAVNYHRWVWRKVIEETFGHRGYYLMATSGSRVCGVLPLIHMQTRLFGRFLVSMPFFSYGGVLASTAQARDGLLTKAADLAAELGARHVELRQGSACETGWHDTTAKVTMMASLPANVEELWKGFSPKMRKRIRYARKHGLESEWGGAEAVDSFFRVFAVNMRNLGTPVYPRAWFENICRNLKGEIRILALRENGRPVASAFLIAFRDTLELPWAASVPESREKFSPLLLYCTLLEWATENGFRRVDLGRCTPGSGNHEFKQRWTSEEIPLHWYYWLAPGVALPALRPDNPRYRLATSLWKRLPLALANALGPRIVRGIP